MAKDKAEKITVENVNVPGYSHNVDAGKYKAMKKAFLKILPKKSPDLTQIDIHSPFVFQSIVKHKQVILAE